MLKLINLYKALQASRCSNVHASLEELFNGIECLNNFKNKGVL